MYCYADKDKNTDELHAKACQCKDATLKFYQEIQDLNLRVLNGAKYISFSQSSNLDNTKIGILVFNYNFVSAISDTTYGRMKLSLGAYDFKDKSQSLEKNESVKKLNLTNEFKYFDAGVSFDQIPLFQSRQGFIDTSIMTTMHFKMGLNKAVDRHSKNSSLIRLGIEISFSKFTLTIDFARIVVSILDIFRYRVSDNTSFGPVNSFRPRS